MVAIRVNYDKFLEKQVYVKGFSQPFKCVAKAYPGKPVKEALRNLYACVNDVTGLIFVEGHKLSIYKGERIV